MRKSCWFGCLLVLAAGSAAPAREASCPTPLPPGRYYIVTRPDPRECPAPVCGGYFVKEVNKPSTRCADGSWQADCHAGVTDESALAWSDKDRARFDLAFGQSEALVHGVLRPRATVTQGDVLAVDEAWLGQARSKPRGIFRGLVDNGMECVTVPCAWINARKLNFDGVRLITGVDFAASGATPEQVAAANEALGAPPGVLAAGPLRRVDTTGQWFEMVASEFYLLLARVAPPEGQACSNATALSCPTGQFCDLASCDPAARGTCRTPPDACPQVYAPVCGCDGVTYPSDCARQHAQVPLAHVGACDLTLP